MKKIVFGVLLVLFALHLPSSVLLFAAPTEFILIASSMVAVTGLAYGIAGFKEH